MSWSGVKLQANGQTDKQTKGQTNNPTEVISLALLFEDPIF